jgi:hypothetical protein
MRGRKAGGLRNPPHVFDLVYMFSLNFYISSESPGVKCGKISMEGNVGKMKDNYKRTTISLNDKEYEVLRYLAFKEKTSVAGVVRLLISELVEEQEDIKDGVKALQKPSGSLDWQSFKTEKLGL